MSKLEDCLKVLDKESVYNILHARLKGSEKKLSEIPPPSMLKNAKKAAKRVADAINNGEKITVVGDYDVDGICSTAIMVLFFNKINYKIDAVIPSRFKDGYGINKNILKRVDADVVITVDNGITAVEAADICNERGIDLIITDHHTPPKELPKAYTIVNPKLDECIYPFKDICGAEVAWLLLAQIKKELGLHINLREFVDILSIAIVADIMPLTDINRALVKDGLRALSSPKRASSIIIKDFLNKPQITSEDIAFQIAPRINSAGRLAEGELALRFLTAESTYEAYELFEKLNRLNETRKYEEQKATKEAIELVDEKDSIIIVAKEGWHEGVVGIVASRLVDRFEKPAIVLTVNGEDAKGSARSLAEVNIYELLSKHKELLEKFGGHKLAAGLTIKTKNIQKLKTELNKTALNLPKSDFIPKNDVLGILRGDDIDFELLDILDRFEPYGEANSRPKFLAKDAKVLGVKKFGHENSHSKLLVRLSKYDKVTHEFIVFRKTFENLNNKHITFSYTINKNIYNNKTYIQLTVSNIYDKV